LGDNAPPTRPDIETIAAAARLALSSITHARLLPGRVRGRDDRTLATTNPAALAADGALRGVALAVRVSVRFDPVAGASIAGYSYRLLERNGRELLVFHWHPDPTVPAPTFPHLHVSARLTVATPRGEPDALPLAKLHLPTGHVSLPAVVRMLIEEFAVRPLTSTWQARLMEAEATLRERPDGR